MTYDEAFEIEGDARRVFDWAEVVQEVGNSTISGSAFHEAVTKLLEEIATFKAQYCRVLHGEDVSSKPA